MSKSFSETVSNIRTIFAYISKSLENISLAIKLEATNVIDFFKYKNKFTQDDRPIPDIYEQLKKQAKARETELKRLERQKHNEALKKYYK